MKYINFKRYKFSTIFKFIDLNRYRFRKISKYLDISWFAFNKAIFKFIDFNRYRFRKISKYLDISWFAFNKAIKFVIPKKQTFISILKKIDSINFKKKLIFLKNKFILLHLPIALVIFGFLYLVIPVFYNYDNFKIGNSFCNSKNIECLIKGKIKYKFYPTPRIKIKNLIINDLASKERSLIEVNETIIKLSFKNLLVKEKHKHKKIELNNFIINLNFENLKKYNDIFKNTNSIPIDLTNGKIKFYDKNNFVVDISSVNANILFAEDHFKAKLKGNFLRDKIHVNIKKNKNKNKKFTEATLKMKNLNLFTKVNFFNSEKDIGITDGNLLIKKDQHRITSIFDYKKNELIISKANLRNTFIDGKLEGTISLLPYFNFDLDVNLSSINFTKLSNYFLSLDKQSRKKLFNINNKINGNLNLSADKIYSSYNLMKSFESRIQFTNNNILIEQFLINLGKLGAADLLGSISNDKKFTNFKFESNIFVDNEKKFLSKFGIYKKKSIFPSLFVSGSFDLDNSRLRFYEITDNEKLNNEDINFIEKEFNYFMLKNGYESLFHFPNFKDFVSSITSEVN